MSVVVGGAISKSGMVENVGLAVGIASPSFSLYKLFPLPVSWTTFRVPDVGRCQQWRRLWLPDVFSLAP